MWLTFAKEKEEQEASCEMIKGTKLRWSAWEYLCVDHRTGHTRAATGGGQAALKVAEMGGGSSKPSTFTSRCASANGAAEEPATSGGPGPGTRPLRPMLAGTPYTKDAERWGARERRRVGRAPASEAAQAPSGGSACPGEGAPRSGVDGISFTVHPLSPWRPFDQTWAARIGYRRNPTWSSSEQEPGGARDRCSRTPEGLAAASLRS